jgi:hypothetical protein
LGRFLPDHRSHRMSPRGRPGRPARERRPAPSPGGHLRRFKRRGRARGRRHQGLLVPAGSVPHGQPARRTRAAVGRGTGRCDADQGLLDGQVRGDAGPLETGRREAARRGDGGIGRRGRPPRWQRQLLRGGGVLPQVHRAGPSAQWEYACRAGTTTASAFGDTLGRTQANFQGTPYNGGADGPSLNRATKVGSYPANAWGLHDMHGNVYEWCRDWYHPRLSGGTDPDLSDKTATSRVRRGGAWCDEGQPCRSARRLRFEPERRSDHIGFRVAVVSK